jgi:23S rRNA (cytidine1920-2'-O)/16S rRNA (cytidine1409-2'-O)-methyltransferase
MSRRERLDALLVERGLVESRNLAQKLIMAGQVCVDGQVAMKPSRRVDPKAELHVGRGARYVSRGGEKLEHALEHFPVSVEGRICADVGASTGGFTDCLLQHGAERVYAIDAGRGQLHWKLRNHPRVVIMERTNARYLESLPEPVSLVTMDVSFISLRLIFPTVTAWLADHGQVVALVKPQFEAAPGDVGKGGVVRDWAVRRSVLGNVLASARQNGLMPRGLLESPLRGPKGNIEFLLWCQQDAPDLDPYELISGLIPSA